VNFLNYEIGVHGMGIGELMCNLLRYMAPFDYGNKR